MQISESVFHDVVATAAAYKQAIENWKTAHAEEARTSNLHGDARQVYIKADRELEAAKTDLVKAAAGDFDALA